MSKDNWAKVANDLNGETENAALRAQLSRLQGELAEEKELTTAVRTDKERVKMELAETIKNLNNYRLLFQESEAARQEVVRELEQLKQRRVKMDAVISKYWHDKTALQSRLTKAEEALKRISEFDCTCPYYMGHDCECPSCRASAVLAALQPEGEPK